MKYERTEGQQPIFVKEKNRINDLPVTGYPCYAQRTLGSPVGKHCKSLERNVWRKVVSTSKKNDFGERSTLFRRCFVENGFGQC